MKIPVIFGPMCPPLSSQLQAFNLETSTVNELQQDLDAINRSYVSGYILESQIDGIYWRLLRQITAEVKKRHPKLKMKKQKEVPHAS